MTPPYLLLASARPGDPYLTWEVVPHQVRQAWGQAPTVLWLAPSAYHGKPWVTGLGHPDVLRDLLATALGGPSGQTVVGLSLPPACFDKIPDQLRPEHLESWSWWWTQSVPDVGIDESVVVLEELDPRLPTLLSQSTSVYLRPGDRRALRWYGLVEDDQLLGCLSFEHHHPDVPHLASIVVDEAARGMGVGRRLCGTVTVQLLRAGAPAVSLAMMTHNVAAAALYRGLGYSCGLHLQSGTIPGRRHLPAEPGWLPGGDRA